MNKLHTELNQESSVCWKNPKCQLCYKGKQEEQGMWNRQRGSGSWLAKAGSVATCGTLTGHILSKQPGSWSWSLKGSDVTPGPGNHMHVLL